MGESAGGRTECFQTTQTFSHTLSLALRKCLLSTLLWNALTSSIMVIKIPCLSVRRADRRPGAGDGERVGGLAGCRVWAGGRTCGQVGGRSRRAGGVRANGWTDTTLPILKRIALNSTSAGRAHRCHPVGGQVPKHFCRALRLTHHHT